MSNDRRYALLQHRHTIADFQDWGLLTSTADWWGKIPYIMDDGVMEIGKYIDFHDTDTDADDYDYRVSFDSSVLNFSAGIITNAANSFNNASDTTWNYHLQLYQAEGTTARPIYQIFHQANRWYQRIKAYSGGFQFVQGATDTLVDIYANGLALGSSGYPYFWNGGSGAVKLTTSSGKYLEMGPQNTSYCHFYTDTTLGFYFGNTMAINGSILDYYSSYALTNAGLLTLRAAGSHITLNDTDGTDPNDRVILENNADGFNLYLHDSSSNTWRQMIRALHATGELFVGYNSGTTTTYLGNTTHTLNTYFNTSHSVISSHATTGYLQLFYNSGASSSGYLYWTSGYCGLLSSNGSWALQLDDSRLIIARPLEATNQTVGTSASAGGVAKPATYAGFLTVVINGTSRKIPYYA